MGITWPPGGAGKRETGKKDRKGMKKIRKIEIFQRRCLDCFGRNCFAQGGRGTKRSKGREGEAELLGQR